MKTWACFSGRIARADRAAMGGLGTRLVVVTRGAQGCEGWTRTQHAAAAAVQVEVVDAVGAGDTFQAAMLTWLDEQQALSAFGLAALDANRLGAMLRFAAAAAAVTCSRRGADMPRREELPFV
ncbi:MAG: PfkB family carbohydrate kinase [Variovorax sp.]